MEPADLGPEAVRPEEVFQDYLFHLRYERALAINSVRNAISVQKQWEAWLGKNARPRHWMLATPEDLAGFLVSRHPLSDQTTNVTRWHIRSLYRWLVREGLASVPLGLGLPPIGRVRPRRAKLVVSPRQMDQILLQPNLDTVEGIRDRVMMEVLYATGVRSQELLNLQLHHIWPRERHAVVQGKGNKERLVVLNDEAAQWVMYHLNEIHPRLLRRRRSAAIPSRGDQFLFPSTRTPHHLSYGYLQQHLQRYGAQAGLPMLTAHVFRHAFATHLYMGGADLVSIQMLMGHASITTTAHYTRVVSDHLRQLIERHHPRGSQYSPFDRSGR